MNVTLRVFAIVVIICGASSFAASMPGDEMKNNDAPEPSANVFDPVGFAQRQLDAYNARDLEKFVREYTDDVLVYRLPDTAPFLQGKKALSEHYQKNRFNLPHLHAELVNRMVFGNKVIDQECVTGVQDTPMDVAAIYEVTANGISKVWFVSGK